MTSLQTIEDGVAHVSPDLLHTLVGDMEECISRRRYIKHLLYERRLDRVKIGKLVRIPEVAIDNLIASGYRPACDIKSKL